MALRDAKRLYDAAVRLQIYVEGVKVNQSSEFHETLLKVDTEFKKLLGRVKYETLDGMSKAELNRLVVTLRQSQSKIYTEYTEKVLNQLREFMEATLIINRQVYAWHLVNLDLEDDEELIPDDDQAKEIIEASHKPWEFAPIFGVAAILSGGDALWSKIANDPIPANGALLTPFFKSFSASAQLSIENLIRKGYSNGWTSAQAQRELTAQLNKIANQAEAVLATAMQHIASDVSAGVQSTVYKKYRWLSVIDSGTTEICLSRNNKVYVYRKGPLPPAHIRCRSTTIPYDSAHDNETFYAFIKRQKPRTQDFALGKKVADMLRAGKLNAKDLLKLSNPSPLTIAHLKKAGFEIITGNQP